MNRYNAFHVIGTVIIVIGLVELAAAYMLYMESACVMVK